MEDWAETLLRQQTCPSAWFPLKEISSAASLTPNNLANKCKLLLSLSIPCGIREHGGPSQRSHLWLLLIARFILLTSHDLLSFELLTAISSWLPKCSLARTCAKEYAESLAPNHEPGYPKAWHRKNTRGNLDSWFFPKTSQFLLSECRCWASWRLGSVAGLSVWLRDLCHSSPHVSVVCA